MPEKLFTVGQIVNTHGIKGELKVVPKTDFADVRFASGSVLHIISPEGRHPAATVTVERARPQKNVFIVKLKDVHNINDAERWKGSFLKITEDQLLDLPSGEYYYHEIVGCTAVTEDGAELGVVTDVLAPGANDVWEITPRQEGSKPILLPVIDEVVLQVDTARKRITVHLLEGLV